MFLKELNDKEKKTFLYLAKKLISIDNKLMASELSALKGIAEEMQIQLNDVFELDNLNRSKEIFTTKKSRISVLLELISLGYIDNDFCLKENHFIHKLAMAFSVPDSELFVLEKWVTDEKNVSNSIKAITAKSIFSDDETIQLEKLEIQRTELLKQANTLFADLTV